MKIKKALCFDDVLLRPRFSDIRSRSQVDLSVKLNDKITLRLPFVASPMDTVSGVQTAIELGKLGGLAIIHRYNTIDEQVSMVEEVVSHGVPVGAAIGATGDFKERADALIAAGAGVICVDIANGYHVLIKEAMEHLKAKHKDIYWMTGNVSCFGGFLYNAHAGSDCVRVGIGGGCFVGGTMVTTKDGEKRIEKVLEGEEVLTHEGRYRKVINTWHFNREESLYKFNGLTVTGNHEFYVVPKKDRDKINEENLSDYAVWISAEELDREQHLLVKKA